MSKPRIIIVDWKSYVESNPKDSLVYKKLYQPLEDKFECFPFFSAEEVPEEVLQSDIHAILLHPTGKDLKVLRNNIPKFILSTHTDM
ncbi:MAG TPA: hypothetical protein VMC80_01115, partial [Patescibacteria group bacterium]|nr:hypothetical protein [Patescibacteria group bacterium]